MTNLRILQLRSEFRDNGPGSQAFSLSRELRRRGNVVLFVSSGGVLVPSIEAAGFEHVLVPSLAVNRRSLADSMANVRKLRRIIKEHSIDVVHAHNAASAVLAYAAAKLAGRRIRLVQSVRGIELRPSHSYRNLIYRVNPAELLAVSEFTKRELVKIGASDKKIHVTYNGVDLKKFDISSVDATSIRQEFGLGAGPVIGHVGNFSGWKGQDILVRTAHKMREKWPDIQIMLIGEGPAMDEVRQLVKNLGMQEHVHMPGLRLDIPQFQAAFDCYCQPSVKGEMFPNAIIEAMTMGNFWVGSDISGLAELTDNGRAGVVVPPSSVDELVKALDSAISDRGLLRKKGERARQFVLENFTIAKVVDRVEAVYAGSFA